MALLPPQPKSHNLQDIVSPWFLTDRPADQLFICPSVTLCIVALRVGVGG